MILAALLLAQAGAAPPPPPPVSLDETRYETCTKLIESDPAKAVAHADAWRVAGGDLPARQCLGLAYVAQERWAPAAIAFSQAAAEAEIRRDGRAATLWVQAGNAALAGEDPTAARAHFDRALALPVLSDAMRGEAHLDRARAAEAIGDLPAARADIDKALGFVPADPLGWLLSANLALREKDMARAKGHVAEAARLSPDDASIAYEQGNVAAAIGDTAAARAAWTRARQIAPDAPAGQAAAMRLDGKAVDPAPVAPK